MEERKKITNEWKNIRISANTRERLMFQKVKHQYVTYDGLINFIIDVLEQQEKQDDKNI